jgi:hypothetical protein
MSAIYAAALAEHEAGLCIVPPREDGTKAPDTTSWSGYQKARPTRQQIDTWYASGRRSGIGYVTGTISNNLELLDFDDIATYEAFNALAAAAGVAELVERIEAGYLESSPAGRHWLYRCDEIAGNTVLARRREGNTVKSLIETRGEGGYVVAAPSNGRVHLSGAPYRLLCGDVTTIARITPEERAELFSVARGLDELPKAESREARTATTRAGKPGEEFNARGDVLALLERHGWQRVLERNAVIHLRRPGKDRGTSATFGFGGKRRFFPFTTSTVFEAERAYSPFAVYAILEHGGDFTAAAQALSEQGYGEPPAQIVTPKRDRAQEQAHDTSPALAIPPFPIDVLPDTVRAFVESAAIAIGCPPDFVAVPMLGLAEGTMGRSRRLVIRPGFEVSPGSWYGVIGEPGTGKSPGQKRAIQLVTPLQDEAWEHYRQLLEVWEATPKDERGEKPSPEHYFITDSTGEALWATLESSVGVTQVEDELRRHLKALDAYRQAGDRQARLAMWSNAPVKIVRRTSAPIYIPFPVAPLVGGIQPGVLRHLRGEGDDAEADDGWVPRFLLSWPDAEPLELSEAAFDARTVPPVVKIFRTLRLRRPEPHDTFLSPEAYAAFKTWHGDNRRVQLESSGLERQWAAKAPVHLARLALVLHLLAWSHLERRPLSASTMEDALTLLEYFREHLARVLPAFGASGMAGTKIRIIRILRTSKHKSEDG